MKLESVHFTVWKIYHFSHAQILRENILMLIFYGFSPEKLLHLLNDALVTWYYVYRPVKAKVDFLLSKKVYFSINNPVLQSISQSFSKKCVAALDFVFTDNQNVILIPFHGKKMFTYHSVENFRILLPLRFYV